VLALALELDAVARAVDDERRGSVRRRPRLTAHDQGGGQRDPGRSGGDQSVLRSPRSLGGSARGGTRTLTHGRDAARPGIVFSSTGHAGVTGASAAARDSYMIFPPFGVDPALVASLVA